jgi:hypothetical protein
MPSNEEVERREVRRVIDTVRGQIPALSQEERAEYETIARGIVADQESLALIASLLKTHFAEEAAKGVLDEDLDAEAGAGRAGAPGAAASTGAATPPAGVGASRPGAPAQTARRTGEGNLHPEGGQPGSEPAPGAGRRRRRRRRRGGGGGPGGQGGPSSGGRFRDRGYV